MFLTILLSYTFGFICVTASEGWKTKIQSTLLMAAGTISILMGLYGTFASIISTIRM